MVGVGCGAKESDLVDILISSGISQFADRYFDDLSRPGFIVLAFREDHLIQPEDHLFNLLSLLSDISLPLPYSSFRTTQHSESRTTTNCPFINISDKQIYKSDQLSSH